VKAAVETEEQRKDVQQSIDQQATGICEIQWIAAQNSER
jgi:hypothetical protein